MRLIAACVRTLPILLTLSGAAGITALHYFGDNSRLFLRPDAGSAIGDGLL